MEPIKMTSEEILKETIKEKYGNVLRFSKAVQIPESSIRNIFNRGVESVSAGVLVKICKALNLDVESLVSGCLSVRPNMQKEKLWAQHVHNTPDLSDDAREVAEAYTNLGSIAEKNLVRRACNLGPIDAYDTPPAAQPPDKAV